MVIKNKQKLDVSGEGPSFIFTFDSLVRKFLNTLELI